MLKRRQPEHGLKTGIGLSVVRNWESEVILMKTMILTRSNPVATTFLIPIWNDRESQRQFEMSRKRSDILHQSSYLENMFEFGTQRVLEKGKSKSQVRNGKRKGQLRSPAILPAPNTK